jgi:hypothetical protein
VHRDSIHAYARVPESPYFLLGTLFRGRSQQSASARMQILERELTARIWNESRSGVRGRNKTSWGAAATRTECGQVTRTGKTRRR